MSQKVLITSALPYANGPLHFGHIAGAYLPADCYARFERLQGKKVLYICGSDEYGVAITLSAEKAGRTPQEHVDLFHTINQGLFQQLRFSFDHYSRTTWKGHVHTTQQFFLDLLANGHIEERFTEQLYSEQEQRFLADRYVEGTCPKCQFEQARGDECPKCGASYEATDLLSPRSKISQAPLIRKETKHWFLLFDHFQQQLLSWINQKKWKPNVVQFAKSYIQDLRPRAITRDSDWGIPIPLPGTQGKVLYVWFDAPIGYISATQEWALLQGQEDAWKEFWLDQETRLVQFIGKDNIPFHAVFFPAMIMGQNLPYKLVDELPANEFYNLEGKQFSKSDGWFIDLERFFTQFSADQIRYAIAANAPESQDAEFSWKDFQLRCNSELLSKYGNLANRTLVFIQNRNQGRTPSTPSLQPEDLAFLGRISALAEEVRHAYAHFHLRKASQCIMEIAQQGNIYFDAQKPWVAVKEEATKPQMEATLFCCLECLKLLALTSSPIIPDSADKLWKLLGYAQLLEQESWDNVVNTPVPSAHLLPTPTVLFSRVEDSTIAEEIARLRTIS